MTIWADGDALPGSARDLLFRAAQRVGVPLVLVANKALRVPESPYLSAVLVEAGVDVADHWIVERAQPGDLVVTADIPLANRVVSKGAEALDPRGSLYTEQNVRERLALRDLMADLRGADLITGGGPPPYTKRDAQRFANALNAFLHRETKKAT
ncbi:MAG: YaiI/YqxD family protein [Candidatus Eremiobacteraeota bacterium]|nr:YaiI/YqxD family protein [Candidatus Eremiobacteraeota bacterium]MCW5872847.1 YaiI/YqxD family protein [Candidatus Eremiobacteraeota bacterium]